MIYGPNELFRHEIHDPKTPSKNRMDPLLRGHSHMSSDDEPTAKEGTGQEMLVQERITIDFPEPPK